MDKIADNIVGLSNTIANIWNTLSSFISSLVGIIQTIFYGLTSLLGAVWDLLLNLISQGVFTNVNKAFVYISNFIGGPATVFISSLLVVAILRIAIAFVFKILRLNIDYNSLQQKTSEANYKEDKRNSTIFNLK